MLYGEKFKFEKLILYFFSKILPLLFLPLGLSLLLLILYKVYKSKKYLYLAIFLLCFFSNGITSGILWKYIEMPWSRLSPIDVQKADAIVVLSGGGVNKISSRSKILEWNDPDRFFAGLLLFRYKKSNNLIFTGGFNPFENNFTFEGNLYRDEAIQAGIPKESIYVTKPVKNTREEVYEINKLLKDKLNIEKPKLLLVTSAFHMTRASDTFKKKGTAVIEFPVDFKSKDLNYKFWVNPLNWFPNSSSLSLSSIAIREIIGRIIYN